MANVYGNGFANILNALDGVTNGADDIWGYGGNDVIYGLGGNDVIWGGSGADEIHGGSGSDYASYSDSNAGVTVSLLSGTGTGGYAEGDTLDSIENLTGSWYDDFLVGDDNNNVLAGLGGNDILKGGGGADTLFGYSGNDTLKGGGGADTLNGGAGIDTANYADSGAGVFVSLINDVASGGDAEGDELNQIENLTGSAFDDDLWGSDGANVLRGNDGEDTLKGFGGADSLYGGDHNDTLYGMDGVDTLRGENGNDTLDGGADNDIMFGGSGDDTMIGGTGDDTMTGGTGDDTYYVDSAADVIIEAAGQGDDTVFSSALGYTLSDHVETLSLDTATDAGVYATGNAQANTIYGNVNDNVLEGGGGADALSGLGGNDNFVFRPNDANGDTVYEFEGNGAGVGDFMYFIGYGTAAEGATFVQLTATTWQINSADGTIHDVITISGGPVDSGDFVFI
jgi:Ca2+-binding RTX toxin-like protein